MSAMRKAFRAYTLAISAFVQKEIEKAKEIDPIKAPKQDMQSEKESLDLGANSRIIIYNIGITKAPKKADMRLILYAMSPTGKNVKTCPSQVYMGKPVG